MLTVRDSVLVASLGVIGLCLTGILGAAPAPDPRNFGNGWLLPDENYCDQPRIVVARDGTWVCVLTTGKGEEGAPGQHVVSASSTDQGRTWSGLVDVEPADPERTSAYALALITPGDRVYAFYCYNGDGIRSLPDGTRIRDDMQGWLCFRYSDDRGRSWSERHRIPLRVTAADRNNQWGGRLQLWWAIGTPAVFQGRMIFGFTKLGRYILEEGEGWFCRSDNVLVEKDPGKIDWQILPEGDQGVRNPAFGSVQEEFDVVHLRGEELFCVYRTARGHAASAYSRDGGRTWSQPDQLRYAPGARPIKQPRACPKIWKTRNGRFLLWFHNNSTTTYNNGPNAGSRNVAWLSAGREVNGFVQWTEPEIVAYVEGGLEGCSYPDLVEDGGKVFICATQKTEARVFEVQPELLEALWAQDGPGAIASNGLVLSLEGEACRSGAVVKAPRLEPLGGEPQGRRLRPDEGKGFTVDVALRLHSLAPGQTLLDTRDRAGRGYRLKTGDGGSVWLEFCDGWQAAGWESDRGLLGTNQLHHVVATVDGRARVITFVVDGKLCDGGAERQFGFGRFGPNFKQISGDRLRVAPDLKGELHHVRLYNRALWTSEAVGNFKASTGARGPGE